MPRSPWHGQTIERGQRRQRYIWDLISINRFRLRYTLLTEKGMNAPSWKRLRRKARRLLPTDTTSVIRTLTNGEREGIHFVCRIRKNTRKEVIRLNAIPSGSIVFYDAVTYLGTKGVNKTEEEVRVVGYRVDGKEYLSCYRQV